jgi:uncharacterized protein DUF6386
VAGRSTRSLAIMKTRISTDTSTIVLFDPACLKHRLHEDADWVVYSLAMNLPR